MSKHIKTRKFKCTSCEDPIFIEMTDEQYEQYINKVKHAEDIFPEMEIELREMLITGECPDCQVDNGFFEFDYIQVDDD